MKTPWRFPPQFLAGVAFLWSVAASAAGCDRACLAKMADSVVSSMVAHAPAQLDLAPVYVATENGVPAAPNMMTIWQTATQAKAKFYVLDPRTQQAFILVTLAEGPHDALLFGRLKVDQEKLAEIELYVDRSRSDGGFQFDADALGALPAAWTQKVQGTRLPNRAELLQAGRAIFDISVSSPPASRSCVLMENGKVVAENPDVLKAVAPPGIAMPARPRNPDGTVSIPCGMPPGRPTDPVARTDIVDEVQGIVVSIATVHGSVEPYIITIPTQSAFVPRAMLAPYIAMLDRQLASHLYTQPRLHPTDASIAVAQMHRVYDGKIQAMMMLQKIGPLGARSPWAGR